MLFCACSHSYLYQFYTEFFHFYHSLLLFNPLNKQLSWNLRGNKKYLKQNTLLLPEQQSFVLPRWNMLVHIRDRPGSLINTAKQGWGRNHGKIEFCSPYLGEHLNM